MKESRFSRFMTKNMPVYTWDTVHNLIGVPVGEMLFLTYCICKNTTGRGNRFLRYCNYIHSLTQVVRPYGNGKFKKCL